MKLINPFLSEPAKNGFFTILLFLPPDDFMWQWENTQLAYAAMGQTSH